jgi:hypothetical protein
MIIYIEIEKKRIWCACVHWIKLNKWINNSYKFLFLEYSVFFIINWPKNDDDFYSDDNDQKAATNFSCFTHIN